MGIRKRKRKEKRANLEGKRKREMMLEAAKAYSAQSPRLQEARAKMLESAQGILGGSSSLMSAMGIDRGQTPDSDAFKGVGGPDLSSLLGGLVQKSEDSSREMDEAMAKSGGKGWRKALAAFGVVDPGLALALGGQSLSTRIAKKKAKPAFSRAETVYGGKGR